jgi:hypothetical protein
MVVNRAINGKFISSGIVKKGSPVFVGSVVRYTKSVPEIAQFVPSSIRGKFRNRASRKKKSRLISGRNQLSEKFFEFSIAVNNVRNPLSKNPYSISVTRMLVHNIIGVKNKKTHRPRQNDQVVSFSKDNQAHIPTNLMRIFTFVDDCACFTLQRRAVLSVQLSARTYTSSEILGILLFFQACDYLVNNFLFVPATDQSGKIYLF